ncbi:Tannase/feruloyl esterase [Lipomyces japonicus]|uniref:Tannase/feruloyl esterase n=1 Tax=Lipomyces japonicus TaxID=56871 RepID=UPI0034CD1868
MTWSWLRIGFLLSYVLVVVFVALNQLRADGGSRRADNAVSGRCASFVNVQTTENFTITNTAHYRAGTFDFRSVPQATLPYGGVTYNKRPFCRVVGQISNSASQAIGFELWLVDPLQWNGRYLAMGNGGLAGSVTQGVFSYGVNNGYATSQSDSGHSFNQSFAAEAGVHVEFLHDVVQTADWIRDSVHYTALASKFLIDNYYQHFTAARDGGNSRPVRSYYQGCSTGGAQGFALAQRHAQDFDGIIAGAPGAYYSHLALSFLYNARVTAGDGFLPENKLQLVQAAAIKACDANDGLVDGLISDPESCRFDPFTLVCDDSDQNGNRHDPSSCITEAQAHALKKIYDGVLDPVTGKRLYNRFFPGSEAGLVFQEGLLDQAFTEILMQNLWRKGLQYNGTSDFDFHADVASYDEIVGRAIDHNDDQISDFLLNHGGKLLVHQGWVDQFNAQDYPIDYFNRVADRLGLSHAELNNHFRLFYQPGVEHCGGGYGPSVFDPVAAVVRWVENGVAPDEIVATQYVDNNADRAVVRTRQYCVWPKQPVYRGYGSVDSHVSFRCQ